MQKWAEIIGQARQSVELLKDPDVGRAVLNILQVCIGFQDGFSSYSRILVHVLQTQ